MPLTKTTQKEILEKAKDRLWDISTVYALDREKIKSWLKRHAEVELGGGLQRDKAIARYPSLSNDLESLYDLGEMGVSEKTMQDAKDGIFEHKAPSVSTIWLFWFLVLIMTGGLELIFFGYMVFFKEAGGALIGLAVLLLAGGFMAGFGGGGILMHGKEVEYGISKPKIEKKYIGWIGAGAALIVGIIIVRGIYGGFLAGVVAAFFGLSVTVAEASFKYHLALRKLYIRLMFKAQQLHSARQIRKELGDEKTPDDDKYRTDYIATIDSISKTIRDTTVHV